MGGAGALSDGFMAALTVSGAALSRHIVAGLWQEAFPPLRSPSGS
jgi:hypothetical protein